MANKHDILRLRRGTAAEWSASQPQPEGEILKLGEPGYEKDTGRLKIGDGITPWNNLSYFNDGAPIDPEQLQDLLGNGLLSAGSGISIIYNDLADTITISTSGVAFLNSPNFTGVPTVPTAPSGTNTTQIASTSFVRTSISNLVDSAPATLDTLNELATALGQDPNFATTITNTLAGKANLNGATFTGSVAIPSGTGNFNSLTVNGTNVSVSGHPHIATDITNFNTSVSGLLPSVTGIGQATSFFSNNLYTISVTGLQPSGNYSTVGHTHVATDIADSTSFGRNILTAASYEAQNYLGWTIVSTSTSSFTAKVGGQYYFPTTKFTGPPAPFTCTVNDPVSGSTGQFYNIVRPSGGYNSIIVGGTTYGATSGIFIERYWSLDVEFPPSGSWKTRTLDSYHKHASNQITDFNSSVSGLLPTISNSGDNRLLTSNGTSYGINGESNATFDGTTLAVSGALTVDNLKLDGNIISSIDIDSSIIIQPSGAGALQRDSSGDTRGAYAVDWQTAASTGTMVALGSYSVICGGQDNTASGEKSAVGGGMSNTASGYRSTIGGGFNNIASEDLSTIAGGGANTASGKYTNIGGGISNTAVGQYSVIAGGSQNTTADTSTNSIIGGGTFNTVIGNYSIVGGGNSNSVGGDLSVVCGGAANNASATCSTIGGGGFNTATNNYTTISGGDSNTANGDYASIGGGQGNTSAGIFSVVGGGKDNTSSDYGASVVGGRANIATAIYSTICGGYNNNAAGQYAIVLGGFGTTATKYGEVSHSAGSFSSAGDSQHSILVARQSTSDNTSNVVLFLDGSSERLIIPAQTTWTFSIKLSAYNNTDNEGAWWIIRGGIRRDNNDNTSLIGSLIIESDKESSLSASNASVVADDTNEALEIRVTGVSDKNIRWVAVVDISQVSYNIL